MYELEPIIPIFGKSNCEACSLLVRNLESYELSNWPAITRRSI
ncbi:MAG: hypothetical protein C1O27_001876 [Chloroflexi bacterium]|jgi:hypothetical protein|nr:MAG: hypothetical protein C1O27_001876 [Chloroflexota bacterium]